MQAAASAQAGAIVQHGGGAYVASVSAVAENGIEYALTPVGGGASLVVQSLQEPMPCNLLTASDALPIAWAVAGGWIAVYMIKSLLLARPEP
ncbi:hypothetical protein [Melaminivora suipulveris]|uniref:hypothetical protein n=1 Tax=Melaminivora suipulveris TaxID=2109913 RepID=UPI00131A4EB3|nr:hypothetical protein [Melaminivora suipulveris]